ncbi:CRISPR-associated protein, Csm1 family [Candidatus Magnetomorum sp. HK-1]|nr:CRISPR-associated protein, Csm1 family [Candidatus Magnetomorum sp. HK-1]
MKTIENIVLTAFLHDICKVYKKEGYVKDNGHFCNILSQKFKIFSPDNNNCDNDHWFYLTQNYYNEKSDQNNTLQKIIRAADTFASAEREEGFDKNIKSIKNEQLIPIIERVDLKNKNHDITHKLPGTKLSFKSKHIFPIDNKEPIDKAIKINTHDMEKDIKSIPIFKGNTNTDDSIQLRCITRFLLSIFEKYLSQVPANINTDTPDVSLYDHLRITAAIAEGLYEYHSDKNDLENANYKDKETSKWLLVCGDFSGIQNFIYKLTSKKAAKGLRGRSLYIQLLCDVSAQYLIKKMNLFPTTLIYSSGGKFYLLIPNTHRYKSLLEQSADCINAWLLKEFRGEMYLGIGYTEVSGKFFEAGRMGIKWKEANESLQKNRLHRFSNQILNTPDFFTPQELHKDNNVCQACSRNDSEAEIKRDENEKNEENKLLKCKHCRVLESIGSCLTNVRYLLWVWNSDIIINCEYIYKFKFKENESETTCRLCFFNDRPQKHQLEKLADYSLEIINDLEKPEEFGFRFIGKWNMLQGNPTEFDEFADKAIGIKRLGILRMDVDNLGEIFVRGFDFLANCEKEMEMGSLSRLATMSRQLNMFFSGYLNVIINRMNRQSEKAQIIYSGGDDLFIIGSWDKIPEIAYEIQQEFSKYCVNKYFTLSGGISMVTGKYPIYHAAMLAGKDESKAKAIGEIITESPPKDTEPIKQKNALCFMDSVIGWEDYKDVLDIKELIKTIIEKTNNRAIIHKLNIVVHSVKVFEQMKTSKYSFQEIHELVSFQKWRWRLIYNLHRMASSYSDETIKNDINELQKVILSLNNKTRLPVLSWLEMPVRWADFLTRKEKTDGQTNNRAN